MDNLEIYIKMCGKSEEIQKLQPWPHCNGDFFHILLDRPNVWLPTQARLQEMIDWNKDFITLDKIRIFYEFTKLINYKDRLFYASMEQLWLAFVMKEKFNKVWDGEEWKVEG